MKFFDRLHPVSAFIYFVTVIILVMLTLSPVICCICFVLSVILYGLLAGAKKAFKGFLLSLLFISVISVTNSLFVSRGATVLFFINNRAITLEAMLYGLFSSMMISSVIFLCMCFHAVISEDKFIYIFGKGFPRLSLVLSMSIGFIPRMKQRYGEISEAQRAMGIYGSDSLSDRIRARLRCISMLLTCSLEESIDTAMSMRARGYGTRRPSSYSSYRYRAVDIAVIAVCIACFILCIILSVLGGGEAVYYPYAVFLPLDGYSCALYALYLFIFACSVLAEAGENILWHYLKLKI